MISIRQALRSDRDNLLTFIKEHWSENHVFVRVPELFDFQHLEDDKIQFLVAYDAAVLVGVLGFIVYGDQYSESDAFIALWKVRDDYQGKIGIDLMHAFSQMGFKSCSCIGIATKVLPIYKFMGYTVGKMNHHFILNSHIETCTIASAKKREYEYKNSNPCLSIREVHEVDTINTALEKTEEHYYKSMKFFKKRFIEHPYFHYRFLGVFNNEEIIAVLVCREQEALSSKILRIVDVVGLRSAVYDIAFQLKSYIDSTSYEYVDLYQYGLDAHKLNENGFFLKDGQNDIFPNYFEPFSKENVDLYWATQLKENYVFFKADGDQDRPNLLER